MPDTTQNRIFSFYGSVTAVNYARSTLMAGIAKAAKDGYTMPYDQFIVDQLDSLAEYLMTEFEERNGIPFSLTAPEQEPAR
jgi:hypothetical protein